MAYKIPGIIWKPSAESKKGIHQIGLGKSHGDAPSSPNVDCHPSLGSSPNVGCHPSLGSPTKTTSAIPLQQASLVLFPVTLRISGGAGGRRWWLHAPGYVFSRFLHLVPPHCPFCFILAVDRVPRHHVCPSSSCFPRQSCVCSRHCACE